MTSGNQPPASAAEPPSTGSSLSQAQDEQHQRDSVVSPQLDTALPYDSDSHARSHSHSHSHSHHHSRSRAVHSSSNLADNDNNENDDSHAKINNNDIDDRDDLEYPESPHEATIKVVEQVRVLLEDRQVDINVDADVVSISSFVTRVVQTISLIQHVDQSGNLVRTETLYAPPNTEVVDLDSGNTVIISAPGSSGTPVPVPGTDPAPGSSNNVPQPPYPTNPQPTVTLPPPDPTDEGALDDAPEDPPEGPDPPSPADEPDSPEEPEEPLVSLEPPAPTPLPPISVIPPPAHNGTVTPLPAANSTSTSSFSTDLDQSIADYSYTSTPSTYSFTSSSAWLRSSSESDDSSTYSPGSYSTRSPSSATISTEILGEFTGGSAQPTEPSDTNRDTNDEGSNDDGGGSGTLSVQDRRIVGGVVGGVAGAAFFLILLLLALKYKKRRGAITEIIGERGASSRGLPGASVGPRTPTDGGAGGGMVEQANPFAVPAALATLTGKPRKPTSTASSPTTPTAGSGGGFVRLSGRKLPSVLQHGGDGFTDPRESVASGYTDYFRGSQEFVPAGSASRPPRLALGSPMRPISGVPVMRSGPARTPVAEENPFADPPSPPTLPLPRDPLGRSRGSQDGSRGSSSRFHEAI